MANKKENKNKKEVTKRLVEELLNNLSVKANIEVEEDKENDVLKVKIDSKEETGLLIGKRGETLFSLQHILSSLIKQELGEWVRIVVNVGDWREKQEDYLVSLAKQTADRVVESGLSQQLYNLNSSQRRVVHLTLSEYKDIETESLGEGEDRYMVIRKKDSSQSGEEKDK